MADPAPTDPPEIGLADAVRALRSELFAAMTEGADAEIQFEAKSIQMEFQVGVTKSAEGKGGVRFWVVELSAGGSYAAESIQRVTLSLAPVLKGGGSVRVASGTDESPLGSEGPKG